MFALLLCYELYLIWPSHAAAVNIIHCVCLHIVFSALTLLVLGGRKGIQPVKNWVLGCWHGYLSGARCRLAYGSADATATHCLLLIQQNKIRRLFTAKKGKQQRLTNQLSILSFMSGRHYTNSSMANVGMMCILLSFLNIDISQCNRLVRVTYLSVMKDLFLFLHSVWSL